MSVSFFRPEAASEVSHFWSARLFMFDQVDVLIADLGKAGVARHAIRARSLLHRRS